MTIIVKYPIDYTGVNANNLVVGEPRDFVGLNKKLIAPRYGAFYEQGLVIRDFFTNAELVPGIDYVAAQLDPTATGRSGLSVYQFIIVLNPNTTKVSLQYQVVGGPYSLSADAIAEFVTMLENDTRPVQWGMLIGTPSEFPPAPHMHDAEDLYGLEYVADALESLRVSILTGDAVAQQDLVDYVIGEIAKVKSTQFATPTEAIDGSIVNKAMSPFTTKNVIQLAMAAMTTASVDWEFNVLPDNDSWGYIRHRPTGFCMAWGSSGPIAPDTYYNLYYRRLFNNIPLVIPSCTTITVDDSTGSDWSEVTVGIPEHAITASRFMAVGRRLSGTNLDYARVKYIAIGISDDTRPISTSQGNVATEMPLLATALPQPVWSSATLLQIYTPTPDTVSRAGVVFSTNVPGGGNTVRTTNMAVYGTVLYTASPGSFIDADYEIMGTAVLRDPELVPNMNYIGVDLGVWHDLSTLKANSNTSPDAGFVWDVVGRYGGEYLLTLTIRKKSNHNYIASRTITIKQYTAAESPGSSSNDVYNTDLTTNLVYYTSDDIQQPLSISFASGINEFGNFNSFAVNRTTLGDFGTPTKYGYYGHPLDDEGIDNVLLADRYEVKVVPPTAPGFQITDSDLPFNTWIGLDVLRSVTNREQDWLIELSGSNVVRNAGIYVHIRHKTDRIVEGVFRIGVDKIGDATTPAWFGGGVLTSAPLVPDNKTFSLDIAMASPAGMCAISLTAGGHRVTDFLTYTHNLEYWVEKDYVVTCSVISQVPGVGGGQFTVTGSPLNVGQNTTGAVFSWIGVNPADVAMTLIVELRVAHRTQPDIYSTKLVTFHINGYVP